MGEDRLPVASGPTAASPASSSLCATLSDVNPKCQSDALWFSFSMQAVFNRTTSVTSFFFFFWLAPTSLICIRAQDWLAPLGRIKKYILKYDIIF